MALSYEYSIGSVRAKETALFTHTDMEQLLGCKNTEELCAMLSDKGYGEGSTPDAIIENHTEKVWQYLKSVAPDFSVFHIFLIQNDAHNFKTVLKGTLSGREYLSLLLEPCTVATDVLVNAVEHRKPEQLPLWLQKAALESYDTLAHTGDARLADAVVDKALTLELLRLAKASGSAFLKKYFDLLVFYNNIKIAIRASRAGAGKDYLLKALCETEGFDLKTVVAAALKGEDTLLDTLSRISAFGCKTAVEQYKESPSAFEKFVDNKLITLARECCKRTSEGAEPLLGYYLGCEAEKKVIHIIASGIRTQSDAEIIRERLREIYG